MNNIIYAVSVDVNNPTIPYNVYVANVLDSNVRYLEITLYQNGNVIALSNEATATASLVTDNVLVDDSVECTISNNIISVPLEDLQRHGNLDVQVTVTEGEKVLAIPFPIQVRVTPNIAENAQINENSLGSYAEVVHEIAEARGTYTTLHDAITAKLDGKLTVKPIPGGGYDDCTESNTLYYGYAGGYYVYVLPVVATGSSNQSQYKLRADNGLIECRTRHYSNGAWGSWDNWTPVGREGNIADGAVTWAKLAAALQTAINAKAPASTAYTFDSTTTNVVYNAANPKTIYLNATVDDETGIVITAKDNDFQYFLGRSGTLKIRYFSGGTSYSNWTQKTESTNNKQGSIAAYNQASPTMYPSIKAVVDYLAANYLGSGDNTVSWANLAAAVQTLINGKESASNKLASEAGIDEDSTDTEYPTAKAVFNFGTDILDEVAGDLVLKENLSNKKTTITGYETSNQFYPTIKALVDYVAANYENLSNKLSSEEGIDSNSTDTEYPSAKAVYDLGVEILALVNDDISNVESRLVLKESASNKQSSITAANKASTALYPSIKAVYDYGSQISSAVEDVKAYIGYTSGDILGLHADFENMQFTRLGAAVGLTAGQDFNAFPMYGQRRRVVVDSDGEIIDNYSPEDVGESDTDVDVMVYQPKFYYKVVPLKLEKQSSGLGYHIRKANYYISSTPHAGFKLHPLFFDKNGNEIDYVLFSAYEASYMWRRQVSTNGTDFRYVDSTFHDGVNTDTTIETSAVLKSLPGVKPISGQYKSMNKVNLENCAMRKSPNWHLDTIQSVSANQLLMAIEYASFNTQSAIGLGIVLNTNSGTDNCSSLTGSTSALGNSTGMASETIYDVAGTETTFSSDGKVSVSYRGIENLWGNIWKHVNGINLWGDGTMGSGQVYICSDFNFNESSHSGNYKSTGLTLANAGGYISAFGYGDKDYDWLFLPSETAGNSSLPVGDNYYCTSNLNGYRVVRLGGFWNYGANTGGFSLSCDSVPNTRHQSIGGRLLYVPTSTV